MWLAPPTKARISRRYCQMSIASGIAMRVIRSIRTRTIAAAVSPRAAAHHQGAFPFECGRSEMVISTAMPA